MSGAYDIVGARSRGGWRRKFRRAFGAILGGRIVDRVTLDAPFAVQQRATVVAELRAIRIDVIAEEAPERGHGHLRISEYVDDLGRFEAEEMLSRTHSAFRPCFGWYDQLTYLRAGQLAILRVAIDHEFTP